MTVIIDSREPTDIQGIGDYVRMLNKGDAVVISNERIIRLERKTISDLISSLESGRLNNQLAGSDELVIYDASAEWLPRGVFDHIYSDDKLRRVINGIGEHTPVKFVTSIQEYSRLLRHIESKLLDGTYAVMRVHARIDYTFDTPEIGFIASLPSIGEELAKQILDYYHSPIKALNNVPNWNHDIKGIGKRKLDTVLRFLIGGVGMKKHVEVDENTDQLRKDMRAEIASIAQMADAVRAQQVQPQVKLKRRGAK
jgi:ERCC4-type nuclease